MTMSAVTLSASRLLVVVVVAAAAVAFGGVDAEVFRGTITDSSCRHDVGTFTFAPQTSFSPEPSVDVAVTRAGFCRVYRGFNESTDTRLEIEDFTTDFRISSVVVDADALDACVADLNVYFAIIRSQAYDAEAECAAFTEGLAEQSVDFSLTALDFDWNERVLEPSIVTVNPENGRVETLYSGDENGYYYYRYVQSAEASPVTNREDQDRSLFFTLVSSNCPQEFSLTNFSNSAEDVYCHGNLAGVAYDVTAFNPQVGAAGMGETSALSLGFFYHVSEGDQAECIVGMLLCVVWFATAWVTFSVSSSLIKRKKFHVTVKLVVAAVGTAFFSSCGYMAYYVLLQNAGDRNLYVFCVGAYLNTISSAFMVLMILLLMKGWTIVRRKLSGSSRVQIAVIALSYLLLRLIENSVGLSMVIAPSGALRMFRSPLHVSWAVHFFEILLFFWVLRSYCTTLANFNRKKGFYAKFIALCALWLLVPPIVFFATVGLNNGRGPSVSEPDYNWIAQQVVHVIFVLVVVFLYNPTATCQMGFPFHKRTSDMRDEADPELLVKPSPVHTVFAEVQEIVKRFALLTDYGGELRSGVQLCEVGEVDADYEDTDLYDMLQTEDENNFSSNSAVVRQRRRKASLQSASSTESNDGGVELTAMGGGD